MLDEIGEDNIMWGSDFPHPDGIWPDSQEYIQREIGHLPEVSRRENHLRERREALRFWSEGTVDLAVTGSDLERRLVTE